MRAHSSTIVDRVQRAGLRVKLRFRVVAVGIDDRGRFIAITTNTPLYQRRSRHAEETLMHKSPPSLRRILIARIGKQGAWLPIDACESCKRLAMKRGVTIERLDVDVAA